MNKSSDARFTGLDMKPIRSRVRGCMGSGKREQSNDIPDYIYRLSFAILDPEYATCRQKPGKTSLVSCFLNSLSWGYLVDSELNSMAKVESFSRHIDFELQD